MRCNGRNVLCFKSSSNCRRSAYGIHQRRGGSAVLCLARDLPQLLPLDPGRAGMVSLNLRGGEET